MHTRLYFPCCYTFECSENCAGGLLLLWNNFVVDVTIISSTKGHIDAWVTEIGDEQWRFCGFLRGSRRWTTGFLVRSTSYGSFQASCDMGSSKWLQWNSEQWGNIGWIVATSILNEKLSTSFRWVWALWFELHWISLQLWENGSIWHKLRLDRGVANVLWLGLFPDGLIWFGNASQRCLILLV